MQIPPRPANEAQRLATLRGLHLLDTPREERFDRITRFAKQLFDVPMTLVTLIEDERQWFKSAQGISGYETARDVSFCTHAILSRKLFLVSDALEDARFAQNPFVIGEPYIRFYAGYPLHTLDGSALGTLCLLDTRPRVLSVSEQHLLQDLGIWVEGEIRAGEIGQTCPSQEHKPRTCAMLEQTNEALLVVGNNAHVLSANSHFLTFFGTSSDAVLGTSYFALAREIASTFANSQQVYQTLIAIASDTEQTYTVQFIQYTPQHRIVEMASTRVVTDEAGQANRYYVFRDISALYS